MVRYPPGGRWDNLLLVFDASVQQLTGSLSAWCRLVSSNGPPGETGTPCPLAPSRWQIAGHIVQDGVDSALVAAHHRNMDAA